MIVPAEIRPLIDDTLQRFAIACSQILEVARQENCWTTAKLHSKVYHPVREATGLKANHVCQAIRRVTKERKAEGFIEKFSPTSICLDPRTFKYIGSSRTVGITLKRRRIHFELCIKNNQVARLRSQPPKSAILNKTRKGEYYISFLISADPPARERIRGNRVQDALAGLNEKVQVTIRYADGRVSTRTMTKREACNLQDRVAAGQEPDIVSVSW
jgi:hypothetical protein